MMMMIMMNLSSMIMSFLIMNLMLEINNFYSPMKYLLFFLIYTMSVFLSNYCFNNNMFYIYKLITSMIIYISGIMIIFSYFITLLNLPKFKFNKINILWLFINWLMIYMYMYLNYFLFKNYLFNNLNLNLNNNLLMIIEMKKIYLNINMLFFMILMLFIVLYFSVKMTSMMKKCLRKKK